jgi:hypothetical protein
VVEDASAPDADVQPPRIERDPFWPIGYRPKPAASKGGSDGDEPTLEGTSGADQEALDLGRLSEEEQQVIKSHVTVGGILAQQSFCLAILNGRVVKEGDDIDVATPRRSYAFRIARLTRERIILESLHGGL